MQLLPNIKVIQKNSQAKQKSLFNFQQKHIQKNRQNYVKDLQPKEQTIDFIKLLLQFKSFDEIQALKVAYLFDIDLDILKDLKSKYIDFTDATLYLSEEKEKSGQIEEAKSDQ